jgi:predicted  nucleic acid-binding Zn-ribbon protein
MAMSSVRALQAWLALAPPDGVWPVTVAGWVGLVLSAASLVGLSWSINRESARRAKKEAEDEARARETARDLATLRGSVDEKLNAFRVSMESELNGLGRRVTRAEEAQTASNTSVSGLQQEMAASRADRLHLRESLDRIEQHVTELRRDIHDTFKRPTQ